ncbi:MAG: hypothetical protein JW750_10715 [Anaerolineaceae bacterium]|nr:hypothetical protein [Anaerolineaceae bacterium]
MHSFWTILLLLTATVMVFILTTPRKRRTLSAAYWGAQTASPNELAKVFAYTGQADRLIEMLKLEPDLVLDARKYKIAAAATGIPMLLRNHEVSWSDTEEIIRSLLQLLNVLPYEVSHAFLVMGLNGNLGSYEDEVIARMLNVMEMPSIRDDEEVMIRLCLTLGYLAPVNAVEPMIRLMNTDQRARVRYAAKYSLQRMGIYLNSKTD